jgi:Rho family protein
MSNRLSGPYYGRNDAGLGQSEDNSTFKVLGSSLETPYDIAKKRQSQIPSDHNNQVSSKQSNRDLRSSTNYQVLKDQNKKRRSDHQVKLVVVGDGGCGKTCLLISYSRGEFPTAYVPTIFENYITEVESADKKSVELTLWDTAGQEEYDRLRPLSYQNVNVMLVCYSVGSLISLNNVKEKWAPEVAHFCPDVPIILVGTKSDLLQDREFLSRPAESVSFEDAENVAASIGAQYHVRCSAKTTENVNQVFNFAINVGLQSVLGQAQPNQSDKKSFKDRLKFKKKTYDEDFDGDYGEYGGGKKARRNHRCIIL